MKNDAESNDAIVAAYLSAEPTVTTTPDIVKNLASQFDRSEASVRSRLVKAGVYQAQLKKGLSEQDKKWIIAYFEDRSLTSDTREQHVAYISRKLNAEVSPINFFLDWSGVGNKLPAHTGSPTAPTKLSRGSQMRKYASIANSQPQYSFQERLDGYAGWFGNPLWILNTIVMLGLVTLVIAAISSIFS